MDRGTTFASILAKNIQNFVWKNIICRYGITIDKGQNFIDWGLVEFYEGLGIRHLTSSVEHHQINNQDEAANKVILNDLKKLARSERQEDTTQR